MKFHNGDPVTAEDVKFSMRALPRGTSASLYKAKLAGIDVLDPHRVRFRFKEPWPDFMTFFGTPATGAGWIVPKKYVEKVGDDGFKKAPVGAGPYKFVSFNPGVELVLEAYDQYWRKPPSVKRLVFKAVPEEVDAAGHAQAWRGRHRLLDPRSARRRNPSERRDSPCSRTIRRPRSGWSSPSSGRIPSRRSPTSGCGSP